MTAIPNPRAMGKTVLAVTLLCLLYIVFSFHPIPSLNQGDSSTPSVWKELRIAVILMATGQKNFLHASLKNKQGMRTKCQYFGRINSETLLQPEYTRTHNYDLSIDFFQNDPMGVMWNKFDMAERIILANQHDWIWYIDLDSLITNQAIRLEDIIHDALANSTLPDQTDFILTPDCFPLNAGVMFLRSCRRTYNTLQIIREYGRENPKLSEQDCIRDVLLENKASAPSKWIVIPQSTMNAFPEEIKCYDEKGGKWEKGSFVVHFAGAWAHMKEEDPYAVLFEKYEKEVIHVEEY